MAQLIGIHAAEHLAWTLERSRIARVVRRVFGHDARRDGADPPDIDGELVLIIEDGQHLLITNDGSGDVLVVEILPSLDHGRQFTIDGLAWSSVDVSTSPAWTPLVGHRVDSCRALHRGDRWFVGVRLRRGDHGLDVYAQDDETWIEPAGSNAALSMRREGESSAALSVAGITPSMYLATCKRRFGTSNPSRMDVPVWEWMVRTRNTPPYARRSLDLKPNFNMPGDPDWCFERMGEARIKMPDGRIITIAGEHEDGYDPDFCIYNDVIVQQGDGVEIYGYPREVFPPTDFHTATLVGTDIFIIGSLGYHDERGAARTPVFRLDTRTYRIQPVSCSGDSPGWIHRHRAKYLDDLGAIEISGGEQLFNDGTRESSRDNFDTYRLSVADGTWARTTDRSSWRHFSISYDDDERAWKDLGWYTGEVLKQLKYPCELFDEDQEPAPEQPTFDPIHTIIVDGVRVLCSDRFRDIRVIVQGCLAQSTLDELLSKLKVLAEQTHRVVTSIEEL